MDEFAARRLAAVADAIAPDGSEVRLLGATAGGSMAMFTLPPGMVARAVVHRTVDEIWYVAAGGGRLWRRFGERDEIIALVPGISVTIPPGARFQFRNDGDAPLDIVAVTMPPWPGESEARPAEGLWPATV